MPGDPETGKAPFWSSLGGILTGLAAVITATAGLIAIFHQKPSETPASERPANIKPATPNESAPSRPVERVDSTPPLPKPPETRPAGNQLLPGRYRLVSVNGIPPAATEMRFTRRSDDHFSAHATVATGLYYDSEVYRQSGSTWSVQVVRTNDPTALRYPLPNEVTADGSSLTFRSQLGTFIWERAGP